MTQYVEGVAIDLAAVIEAFEKCDTEDLAAFVEAFEKSNIANLALVESKCDLADCFSKPAAPGVIDFDDKQSSMDGPPQLLEALYSGIVDHPVVSWVLRDSLSPIDMDDELAQQLCFQGAQCDDLILS